MSLADLDPYAFLKVLVYARAKQHLSSLPNPVLVALTNHNRSRTLRL
jgi:hypothetical protein